MIIFKKKATDIQETKKLPMTGKVKKGFRAYCTMVIVGALALGRQRLHLQRMTRLP